MMTTAILNQPKLEDLQATISDNHRPLPNCSSKIPGIDTIKSDKQSFPLCVHDDDTRLTYLWSNDLKAYACSNSSNRLSGHGSAILKYELEFYKVQRI